ncbi:hypothetical protein KF840_01710 [bacterium]|nr:hypothetical protein [bacterium]
MAVDSPPWLGHQRRMEHPARFAIASAILAVMAMIIWLGAPIVPTVIGAALAGYYVYWRDTRRRR